jgi:CubicO group peptidase (beta-lactamase class C family)
MIREASKLDLPSLAVPLLVLPPLILLGALVLATTAEARQIDVATLDSLLETDRKDWDIPGLAVAIVQGDSVVLVRGYGVREAGGAEPVDAHTLFAIGSTTKAFTSTALAMLVGEGALGWDDRVVDRLPGFTLEDPWVTGEITIRDLLAQRSGLPMANLMWLSGQHDRSELVRRIRFLEPATSFRSAFSYQNVLYTAAGIVVETVAGKSWTAFLRERVFRPLKMERTNTSVDSLVGVGNVATPHAVIDGEPRAVHYRNIDHVGPAGSINSSAAEMAQWLRLQLGGGDVDGRRLVAEEALEETRRPQIVMPLEGPLAALYPEARSLAYGMGWVISDYRGRTLLDHGGGIDGMTSLVALVPEEGLGVAILTSVQLPTPPYWILYTIFDRYLEAESDDWSAHFRELHGMFEARPTVERVPMAEPSLPLDRYAGMYDSAPLGEIGIEGRDESLHLRYGRLEGPLEPWHFDTFRVLWNDPAWLAAAGPGWVTFRLGREGGVEGFELEAIPGETWGFDRIREVAGSGPTANR